MGNPAAGWTQERRQRQQQVHDAQDQAIAQQNAQIEAQNEQAKRAAVLQFLGQQQRNQQIQQQQLMNSFRPPLTTNCTTYGNQTGCTTR